jgi:diphthine synthase
MLYIIGIGLNLKSLTREAFEAIKSSKKVYLEGYTVDFPYEFSDIEKEIGNLEILGREKVESSKLIEESKKNDISLLVYGSPFFATTHLTLLADCKKAKVKSKMVYNASVFDALGETGLELYKFGKITSMPRWQKNFEPDSFIDVVKENLSIKAHSLILCDIGLSFHDALKQLEESLNRKKMKIEKLVAASSLGTEKSKIFYDSPDNLKKKAKNLANPFCIIIPSELHFVEKEFLENI